MVGIENLKKIVVLGAEGLNVGSKIIHGGGLLSLLGLVDEVSALGTLDKNAILAEVKDLSEEEKKMLSDLFKSKLQLQNAEVEKKIEAGVDVLNEAVLLAAAAVDLYKSGAALVDRVKGIIA